jgi:hydrogenase-1 operon protein HyaF
VLTDAARRTSAADLPAPAYPAGCMNAQALVEEIRLQAAAWQPGEAAHIINLTLLPVSDADLDTLYIWLGHREVSILSRGYGNCRITSTRLKNVWWVQYFNSMDTLILNSIEVVGMPEVALASDEDFVDSVERLREYLDMMAEPV